MPRAKQARARYPQKCKICGHTWLSFSWKGPLQCPSFLCGNTRWRKGPSYLTANRRAQGWEEAGLRKTRKARRELERAEVGLAEVPLYVEPIAVEPEEIQVGVAVGSGEGLEGVQEALRGSGEPKGGS